MAALPRATDIAEARPSPIFARRETTLGDGYRRLARKGINSVRQRWRLTWVPLQATEANEIIDFLEGTAGVDGIQWTPPNSSTEKTWSAEELTYPYNSSVTLVVSVTLEEFFGA